MKKILVYCLTLLLSTSFLGACNILETNNSELESSMTNNDTTSNDTTFDDTTSDDTTSNDTTSSDTTSDDMTSNDTTSDNTTSDDTTSDDTTPEVDIATLVDFIVEVEEGKDPVVLQLSDTQIIDAAQERTPDRLGSYHDTYWATDKMEDRCYGYLRETISTVQPDLIILTGDIIYGSFDDNGSVWEGFIEFMESFDIPWAPIFGNHDNESARGVEWQCAQLESAENCLFKRGEVSGNGNYSVGIVQGGELKRVFYMLDTHGCLDAIGLRDDQVDWYTRAATNVRKESPETKISIACHIQPYVFFDAYRKYGFTGTDTAQNQIFIDQLTYEDEGDFGFLGADLKTAWDTDYKIWQGMKALGVDSIFVGHEHANSASVVYDGVRFQYGQKSSTYDRANYVDANGIIETSYQEAGTPIVGGTVIPLSASDGAIKAPYIYLCNEAGGAIDWDQWKHYVDDGVEGLKNGKDFTAGEQISVASIAVMKDSYGYNVQGYQVTAAQQGKLFINTELLKNATAFAFKVKVPENMPKLDGHGEFSIRVKGVDEPQIDGRQDGYIDFNSASLIDALKIEPGEWQYFVVDISNFGEDCSEFAFIIPAGGSIYLKDMEVLYGVPYASWHSGYTSIDTNAPIPGGWNSKMFSVTLSAGDTLTLTERMDWSGKTVADNWTGYSMSLNNMLRAEYQDKEITLTFTNPKDLTEYISFKNVMDANGRVVVYVTYSKGKNACWTMSYFGSDVGDSCFHRMFSVIFGVDGVKSKWFSTESTLAIDNMFTNAIVTMTSETGISVTFESLGGERNWQLSSYLVKYYVADEMVYSETVKEGSAVKYADIPVKENRVFIGWYETKALAEKADPFEAYDMSTPVIGNIRLYAGFVACAFQMESPLKNNYLVNEQCTIPQATYTTLSETVVADISVKDPQGNGVAVTNGTITPTTTGTYKIIYTATIEGESFTEERSFSVVSELPFASWTQEGSSIDTNASVPGGWGSGMFGITVAAGDTITLTDTVEWSGKALSDKWFAYQISFNNGTKEEYVGREITIKFVNPEDETDYITLKNVMSESGQVVVYASYSKGGSATWTFCKYGSNAGSSYDSRIYTVYIGIDGIKGIFRTSEGTLGVSNFFTEAIVTISSSTGISATFTYLGNGRDWQS